MNLTADAHPIHLHLVQFQLMNRQRFDVEDYAEAYAAAFAGGAYRPGVGPPLDYRHGNPAGAGGNPDIAPVPRRSTPDRRHRTKPDGRTPSSARRPR